MKNPALRLKSGLPALCISVFACVALTLPLTSQAAPEPSSNNAAVAASGVSTLPPGVIAVVNGVPIAQTQLDLALRASNQPDTPQIRQTLKLELIAREIFRQGAEKAHYGAKPEVQAAMEQAKANAETQLYLKDNIHPELVTDAQVKARYDEIVASLGQEDYKPRVIIVADDTTAATVLTQLKGGAAFDALARQDSVGPTKASGGEMAWVSFKTPVTEGKTQGLPVPVAQALTQLPVGGITPTAIVVGNERVIVKLDAKRPTQVPTFDQAQETVRNQLQAIALEKATATFVGAQMKTATVQQ